MKSLLNLRCHVLFDPTTEKNIHNTHTNPGLDNLFRLMLPICHSAFHCKVNQYRTNIPFNYTGRCIPKAQSPKRSTTKSSCSVPTLQNPLQEMFAPPPWQPSTVIDHHKTTHDQVFWRLHLSFKFFTFKKQFCSLFFVVYTRKSLQTTLSFFWVDLENLSGIYLKITIYKHLRGFLRVSWRASC